MTDSASAGSVAGIKTNCNKTEQLSECSSRGNWPSTPTDTALRATCVPVRQHSPAAQCGQGGCTYTFYADAIRGIRGLQEPSPRPQAIHATRLREIVEKASQVTPGPIVLRDFRTVDAASALAELRVQGLGRRSLQHAKSLLSGIFTIAKSKGWYDGLNPVQGALIPKRAKAPQETHATTPEEVLNMLDALKGKPQARAAIALMYLAGLSTWRSAGSPIGKLPAGIDHSRGIRVAFHSATISSLAVMRPMWTGSPGSCRRCPASG